MTFFYNLNKKLNSIESALETTQLNERDMGKHNNATTGFKALAKKAGGGEKGDRIAGAQFQKMKKAGQLEEAGMDESAFQAAIGKKKYGEEGMKALQKAGRDHASDSTMSNIRKKYDKYDEGVYQGGPDKSKIPAYQRPNDPMTLKDLEKERTQSPTSPEGMRALQDKLKNIHPLDEVGDTPAGLAAVQKVGRRADRAIGDAGTGYSGSELDNPDKTYAARDRAGAIEKRERDRANEKNPTRIFGGPKHGERAFSEEGGVPMTPKQKSFAKLAPPADKITFADKIAGAKKEVDEMLGDVAAEAMKAALGKGKKIVADEDNTPKVGDVTHGAKHDIEHTATGRKVTRRHDDQGMSVGSEVDDEGNKQEKRGRGRPKGPAKGTERVTAKATKHKGEREKKGSSGSVSDSGKALQGFMIGNKPSKPVGKVSVKHKMKEGDFGPMEEDAGELKAAMALLKKAGYKVTKSEQELDEKAVSKKQQKFMGMVHATQKGEKAPSKEVAKVAKSMKKKDAEDFASTKHEGLPEKAPKKKKEKTEEAGGTGTPTASSGFSYGKGIYDSLNRDLENAITESMNQLNESMSVNMSDSTEGGKSLTITATDEDALQLASLLKSAGLGGGDAHGHAHDEGCADCGQSPCGCDDEIEMDEAAPAVSDNEPDYPTNTEEGNALEYSGGLNGPKSTGQSTVPVLASQDDRQHSYAEAEEDAIKRMMEMAGIKEAKKVEEDDVEEGNKFTAGLADDDIKVGEKIPGTNAIKKKDIDESILASTRALWKKYQG